MNSSNMLKKNQFIQYKIFEPYKNLVAFTSTKQSFSTTKTRFTGDSSEIYIENRVMLAKTLGIETSQLVFPRQTHTDCVVKIDEIPENEIVETDALVSNCTGICLCVQTADCVPILLFDPKNKVIASVHAGWRGTVKKIAAITVRKMVQNYGSEQKDIVAAIGPSISPGIYEVGDEVTDAVRIAIPNFNLALHKSSSGKYHVDLWEANRQILLETGLQPKHIEVLGECSFVETDKYYSARKEGIDTGRMVSGILLL